MWGKKRKRNEEYVERQFVDIKNRLKQLECPHAHLDVREDWNTWEWVTRCKDCGKIMEDHKSELAARIAEKKIVADGDKKRLAEIEARIKELKEAT